MKKKSVSLTSLLSLSLSLVGVILTVVSVCSPWLTYKTESVVGDVASTFRLSELGELEGYGMMCALAYVTLSLAVIALGLRVAEELTGKVPGLASKAVGILAIASAVAVLVASLVVCSENGSFRLGSYASGKFTLGAGAILSCIGGVLGGAGAALHLEK